MTLASVTSFMGRTDATTLASIQHSAVLFTWATTIFSLALALSFTSQLLLTSPHVQRLTQEKSPAYWVRLSVAVSAWLSLGLVVASLAIFGEGLKVITVRAGQTLQWSLLALGLPTATIWAVVCCLPSDDDVQRDHRRGQHL